MTEASRSPDWKRCKWTLGLKTMHTDLLRRNESDRLLPGGFTAPETTKRLSGLQLQSPSTSLDTLAADGWSTIRSG